LARHLNLNKHQTNKYKVELVDNVIAAHKRVGEVTGAEFMQKNIGVIKDFYASLKKQVKKKKKINLDLVKIKETDEKARNPSKNKTYFNNLKISPVKRSEESNDKHDRDERRVKLLNKAMGEKKFVLQVKMAVQSIKAQNKLAGKKDSVQKTADSPIDVVGPLESNPLAKAKHVIEMQRLKQRLDEIESKRNQVDKESPNLKKLRFYSLKTARFSSSPSKIHSLFGFGRRKLSSNTTSTFQLHKIRDEIQGAVAHQLRSLDERGDFSTKDPEVKKLIERMRSDEQQIAQERFASYERKRQQKICARAEACSKATHPPQQVSDESHTEDSSLSMRQNDLQGYFKTIGQLKTTLRNLDHDYDSSKKHQREVVAEYLCSVKSAIRRKLNKKLKE